MRFVIKPYRPKYRRDNPIVWNRDKWRWRDRHVPLRLCFYEWRNGEVAMRRMRPPGWLLMQQSMRQFKAFGLTNKENRNGMDVPSYAG